MVPFDADLFWRRVRQGELSLFMAVPTIYARLVKLGRRADPGQKLTQTVKNSVMVSPDLPLCLSQH